MAGSYGHVTDDEGRLLSNERVAGMLENGGDVYEAVEEMYGMIWYLAHFQEESAAALVEEAQDNYRQGIELSPGRAPE